MPDKKPTEVEAKSIVWGTKAEQTAVADTSVTPAAPTPPAVFALTSEDRFILVDTNNDGIPDRIDVIHQSAEEKAAAKKKSDDYVKFGPFNAAVAAARTAAVSANAGRPAVDIAAAEERAEASVRVSFKGAIPPPSDAEKAAAAAKKAEAEAKSKVDAEIAKMKESKA